MKQSPMPALDAAAKKYLDEKRRLELRVISAARNSAKCIRKQIGFSDALEDERRLIHAVEALDDAIVTPPVCPR